MDLPRKKYQIIYADPPWAYKDTTYHGGRNVIMKYPVMKMPALLALPVREIAADDCVLLMWVTMPKLNQCFDLITAWGFEYKTVAFVWVKRNKNAFSWFWGMGRWTRANAELCLLATKGDPKRISASVHSIVEAPIQAHSQKPAEVRGKIVELLGDLPRIELFARQRALGWDAWGNEVSEQVQPTLIAAE